MRLQQILNESPKIDNVKGMGAVPNNQEVDYLGLRVMMKPQTFLKLAKDFAPNTESIENMKKLIKNGKPIGSPFLDIILPEEWQTGDYQNFAIVSGHEGRHRMVAIMDLYGDSPIEVHLFFRYGVRNRDLTSEIIARLIDGMVQQNGDYIKGPLFRPLQPL